MDIKYGYYIQKGTLPVREGKAYSQGGIGVSSIAPVVGCLAHFLLEQFQDQRGDVVSRDLTLDEMAARIGSTREMVCRHLYHFADEGAIYINRTEIRIKNWGMLEKFEGSGKS